MKKKWMVMVVLVPLMIFLVGYLVFILWNCLVPSLFNGPVISFWQALGLLLLSKILFGGFKGGKMWKEGCDCRGSKYWKEKMKSEMAHMTPEEKEKVKEAFKKRCGADWQ